MTIPLATQREETESRKAFTIPTNLYTPFLLLLNVAALSVAFLDAKGIVLALLSLAYTAHMRVLLTQRAEQRRTNDLLEELLDTATLVPVGRE